MTGGASVQVRPPAVAGRFYPADAAALAAQIEAQCPSVDTPLAARMVIAPHAGLVYSGAIAGATYAAVEVPERVLLLGPNHTGRGARVSAYAGRAWAGPGFEVPIDRALLARLVEAGLAEFDLEAHVAEHSLELHLPFLHFRQAALRLAPLCVGALSLAECERRGRALAGIMRTLDAPPLLAVSSDMHHFASAKEGARLDAMALAALEALDPVALYETVRRERISMCGVIPATLALFAALELGVTSARLIRYGHSGEVSGDHERVVGYAGLAFV